LLASSWPADDTGVDATTLSALAAVLVALAQLVRALRRPR
jgi:hypothetical protein